MKITLINEQKHVLNHQMQQYMQLLQMDAQELDNYLRELALENPMLERTPPKESAERAIVGQPIPYRRHTPDLPDLNLEQLQPTHLYDSFRDMLSAQVAILQIPELLRREVLWLIGEIDERGYLPSDAGDLKAFGGDSERYENAVRVLQSLEPAGVGARNLAECLHLQLSRRGLETSLAVTICRDYLPQLAKGQFNAIARALNVPREAVVEARDLIITLDPYPSNGFADAHPVVHIIPDVEISFEDGQLRVTLAERYMPTYRIDSFYTQMSQRGDLTEEERIYFKTKLTHAKWAVSCVARRQEMLMACAQAIAERQASFFSGAGSRLVPLTMTELAEQLGTAVSTVSRAVKGKYIACSRGTFPMTDFFTQEIGGTGGTREDVLIALRALIAEEDAQKPLSDQKLAELLSAQGYPVARRTVAKYRSESSIPPASARRRERS